MKTFFLAILAFVSLLSFEAKAQLTVNTLTTTGLSEPYNVVEDANYNVYISDSANNRIVMVNGANAAQSILTGTTGSAGTNDGPAYAAQFSNPQGLLPVTIGGINGLLVADTDNQLIRFVRLSDGYVTTLAGMAGVTGSADSAIGRNATFTYPYGLTQDGNGNVYICDHQTSKIRVMNLNDPNFGVSTVTIAGTSLNQPQAITYMGTNQFWVADTGNNTIKLITLTSTTAGSLTTYIGSNDRRTSGTTDSSYGPNARFNQPAGLLWDPSLGLLISDTGNNTIRLATNNPTFGVTNFTVITLAGTPGSAGLVNGMAATAKLYSPYGIWRDDVNSYYFADGKNNAIRSLQYGTRNFTPVSTPAIGYVTRVTDPTTGLTTVVFNTDLPKIFNNIPNIQITGDSGTYVYYTIGNSTLNFPDPTQFQTIDSAPAYINDELTWPTPLIASSGQIFPYMTIKAIGAIPPGTGRRPISAVAYGQFIFVTANPGNVNPNQNDPQHIQLSSATTNNTVIYYTLNGSAPSLTNNTGILLNGAMLQINATNFVNGAVTLKAIAHSENFADSQLYQSTFYQSNSLYDAYISFGFPSGEASSAFVASPGQTFYAPVTITLITNVPIYSLQFNLTVAAGTNNPGPPVATGAYGFNSFLEKPIPNNPVLSEYIPPLAFIGDVVNPPPTNAIVTYDTQTGPGQFANLMYYNTSLNLIGVGWLERYGEKNLYDSTVQTLISYSQPHDKTFTAAGGQVVVGGYTFQIPLAAPLKSTYQIQIGRPSATSDGIGAAGSVVNIHAADSGSVTSGAINATKTVTVGQLKYVAGDAYPFQWFNAGDFGNGVLDNADVEQVFEAAAYNLDAPPAGSDFFDSMDSCGNVGVADISGIYHNAGSYAANYPSTNYLSFTSYNYYMGYSNVVTQVNTTTNIYYNTNSYTYDTNSSAYTNSYFYITNIYSSTSTQYITNTYLYFTNTTILSISNFTYMDPVAGVTTYTAHAMDNNIYYTNTDLVTNSVAILTTNVNTAFISNNVVVLNMAATNRNVFTNTVSGNIAGPDYTNEVLRSVPLAVANYNINGLFDGNDSTINSVVFGDGNLDVCDVYVTFRRSLDPSLTWFRRYWSTGGVRVAEAVPNVIPHMVEAASPSTAKSKVQSSSTVPPLIDFSAGEIQGSAGSVVQIPINATIFGSYPLRVLMLNLTVTPLDGSPAITTPVQFTDIASVLGTPDITDSKGNGNYSAAWLNSTNSGLTGTVTIGTLTVTIPSGASSNAAYAVHFDHVSASPNGLASFPSQTLTGLVALSSRTNSTYGDGIPDLWRLRWFGTVNNLLSVSNACPTGDGISNWKKYLAGVDPTVANDFPSVNPKTPVPSGSAAAIHWSTVSGKQYAVLSSPSLFPGNWTTNAIVNGTGTDIEWDDTSVGGKGKFYRVLILP